MSGDPPSTVGERAIAVAALVWIPLVWVLSYANGVAPLWGLALFVYGSYGLMESIATLADRRDRWRTQLQYARYGAISFVAIVFIATIVLDRPL